MNARKKRSHSSKCRVSKMSPLGVFWNRVGHLLESRRCIRQGVNHWWDSNSQKTLGRKLPKKRLTKQTNPRIISGWLIGKCFRLNPKIHWERLVIRLTFVYRERLPFVKRSPSQSTGDWYVGEVLRAGNRRERLLMLKICSQNSCGPVFFRF